MSASTQTIRFLLQATLVAVLGAGSASVSRAAQIDAATFFLIENGMEESEVLIRAGAPDLVTSPGGEVFEVLDGSLVTSSGGSQEFDSVRSIHTAAVRRWHYIPDTSEHDPHLTVITMKSGRVFNIERKKVFSRQGLPEPRVQIFGGDAAPKEEDIVRGRLERTLDAAEHYARIRSNLKREGIELTKAAAELPQVSVNDTQTKVYRSKDGEGVVYYGDRPESNRLPNVVDY